MYIAVCILIYLEVVSVAVLVWWQLLVQGAQYLPVSEWNSYTMYYIRI